MFAFTTFATPMRAWRCWAANRSAPWAALLGHEKPSTTLKYAHLSDASVRAAVDALAPVLAGRPT